MPRRCHTKSRKGCVQCKERHIKCDEHRPTCSLCVRREVTCTYVSPPPRRKPTTDFSQPASIRSASATLSPPVTVSRLPRLEEMRLLHHALMVTSPTFIKDDIDREFWQMVVPRIATDHGYVLDGFLAVAALHLASLEPGRSSHWLETALRYQNSAIIGLRQHLATSEQNREALFSCSVLNLVFVTASPGIQGEGHPVDPLGGILTMRSFLSGTAFLFLQIYHGKEPTSIDFWIRRDRTSTVSKDCEDTQMVELHQITINELHAFRKTFGGLHIQHQEIYHSTHDLLLKAIEGWPTEDSISWPIKVEDAFLDLVKQGDWIARIMLLFHGIGMHLMSRKWFAKGSGRRLINGILQPLEGQIPPEWRDLIAWVRGAVEI